MMFISELSLPPALNMPLDTLNRELCGWRCSIWVTHTRFENSQAGEFLQWGPAAKLDSFGFDPWDPGGNGREPISQNYSLTSTCVLWHRCFPQNKVNNLDFGKPLLLFFSPTNVSTYAFVRHNHYSIGQKPMYEHLDALVQSKGINVMQAVLPHPSQNTYTAVKLTALPSSSSQVPNAPPAYEKLSPDQCPPPYSPWAPARGWECGNGFSHAFALRLADTRVFQKAT